MNKVYCPYCAAEMDWSDKIDLSFNGNELSTIDIYTCNECLKEFEIQIEFKVTPKNYKIIDEL